MEDPAEIERLFDEAREAYGKVDYFVANAAAAAFKPIEQLKVHHLDRTYAMNVRAFVLGAQQAVSLMGDGGRIVVLSSYGSIRAYPTYAALGAAKAALEAYVRYMAVEFGPRGINVNAVNGGIIESDSSDYFYGVEGMPPLDTVLPKIPKRRMGTVQEVADCIWFLLHPALGVRHRPDPGRGRRAEHRRAAVPRRRDGSARPARHDRGCLTRPRSRATPTRCGPVRSARWRCRTGSSWGRCTSGRNPTRPATRSPRSTPSARGAAPA